jgi:hypothetical protein
LSPDFAGRVYRFYDLTRSRNGAVVQDPHPGYGRRQQGVPVQHRMAVRVVSRPSGRVGWGERWGGAQGRRRPAPQEDMHV